MEQGYRKPSAVDVHVGARIRVRRRVLGLTQEDLARALDVTFQQIQKYERGANRVSASKLFAIAGVLGTPVQYFFEGLGEPGARAASGLPGPEAETAIRDFLQTTEGLELAMRFLQMPKGRLRRQVLELVRALTDDVDGSAGPDSPVVAEADEEGVSR